MKKVYKYEITSWRTIIDLPQGSQILCTGLIQEKPMVWMLIPEDYRKSVQKIFYLHNTGEDVIDNVDYIGTYFFANGIVQHLFEQKKT